MHRLSVRDSRGFTLIELLVVIIIIGVLAAIAIPSFIQHRDRAWDIAIRSDLRNAAITQDAMITVGPTGYYAASAAELLAAGFRPSAASNYYGGTFAMTVQAAGEHYCLTARSQSGTWFGFSSAAGGLVKDTAIDPSTCA